MKNLLFGRGHFLRWLAVIIACVVQSSGKVGAQECVNSFDGSVGSIIGTDFDYNMWDTTLANKGYSPDMVYRDMYATYTTTMGGVKILPGLEGEAVAHRWGKNFSLREYDTKDGRHGGKKNAYFVTDRLEEIYGNNPYSIVPKGSNGNSFYVFHNFSGTVEDFLYFYFPYMDYRGRDVELVVKFYYGNKGVFLDGPEKDNYTYVNGAVSCPSCSENPDYVLHKINGPSKESEYGSWRNMPANGNVITSQSIRNAGGGSDNMRGVVDFGVNSTFGATTTVSVTYLGDAHYGFISDSTGTITQAGNPAQLHASVASDGNLYGWYEMKMDMNNINYPGSGDLASFFNVYFNGYNFSSRDFIAYDYINVQTAHICASVKRYCPNQEFTLTPYYYKKGHELEWQKLVVKIITANDLNNNPEQYKTGSSYRLYHAPKSGMSDGTYSTKASLAVGDTVVIEEWSQVWKGVATTGADVAITQSVPQRYYDKSYTVVFRAVDKTAATEGKTAESFEVWLHRELNPCDGEPADTIVGNNALCVGEKDIVKFAAMRDSGGRLIEVSNDIVCNWKLYYKDKSGAKIDYTEKVDAWVKRDANTSQTNDGKTAKVSLNKREMPEGVYVLSVVQSLMWVDYDNKGNPVGSHLQVLNGGEALEQEILIFHSPKAVAELADPNTKICVSDPEQVIEFKLYDSEGKKGNIVSPVGHRLWNNPSEYYAHTLTYSATDATMTFSSTTEKVAASANGVSQGVIVKKKVGDIEANLCADNSTRYKFSGFGVKMSVDDVKAVSGGRFTAIEGSCKSDTFVEVTINDRRPVKLDCGSIEANQRVFEAKATEKEREITLVAPLVSQTCQANPKFTITATHATKGVLMDAYETTYADLKAGKVKLMIPLGVTKVEYTVTDGCGSTDKCETEYELKDVTPPDVDCDAIKGVKVRLKDYNSASDPCKANLSSLCANELAAPVLEDKNGVDGAITGVYMGRWKLDDPTTSADVAVGKAESGLFEMTAGDNPCTVPYATGKEYILWKFEDEAGNKKYCVQQVEVVDDTEPEIECPSDPNFRVIGTDEGCFASYDRVIDSIKAVLPQPKQDLCRGKDASYTMEYWIITLGADGVTRKDSALFTSSSKALAQGKYLFQVRYYKKDSQGLGYVDETVYAHCELPIEIKDIEPPTFDCNYFQTVYVDVNYYNNPMDLWNHPEFSYASAKKIEEAGAGPSVGPGVGPGFGPGAGFPLDEKYMVYTLKDVLKKGAKYDPDEVKKQVKDNCGKVTMSIRLILTSENDETTTTEKELKPATIEELRKIKFYEGDNQIVFSFTDEVGNTKECELHIVVAKATEFKPNCDDKVDTLKTDANCNAFLTLDYLTDVPSAVYNYEMEQVMAPSSGCVQKQNPLKTNINLKPDMVKIVNLSEAGDTLLNDSIKNPYAQLGSYTKVMEYTEATTQFFNCVPKASSGSPKKSGTYTEKNFDASSFTKAIKLEKGHVTLTWYYFVDGAFKGACLKQYEVVDEMPPTLDCGAVTPKLITRSALDPQFNCVLPFDKSGVKMHTIDEFDPKDNCTDKFEDANLTFRRAYYEVERSVASDSVIVKEFAADFPIGYTYINFIVTDNDGNSSSCEQVVHVVDSLPPYYNCDDLVSPITVPASEQCDASYDKVVELGLPKTLEAYDCSYGTEVITAVPSRSDGLELKEKYKGTVVISWTFTDKINDVSRVCKQTVIVADTTKPNVDCSAITDFTYEAAPTECEPKKDDVLLKLGKHTAEDNCDGTIEGVPYWAQNATLEELPEKFALGETYILVWVFKDAEGNEERCMQTLDIKDTTPIPLDGKCPDPIHLSNANTQTCVLGWDDLNVKSPIVHDECDDADYEAKYIEVEYWYGGEYKIATEISLSDVKFAASDKVHYIHWIFEDKANNRSECVQEVYYTDELPPVVNCDPAGVFDRDEYSFTVSDDDENCELKAVDFDAIFHAPEAYDECDDIAGGTIKAPLNTEVYRYYYEDQAAYDSDRTTGDYNTKCDANGKCTADMTLNYKKGITKLVYNFEDNAGNKDACNLLVKVKDLTPPFFECDSINSINGWMKDIRPALIGGECEVKADQVDFPQDLIAKDYCSDPRDVYGNLYRTATKEYPVMIYDYALGKYEFKTDYKFKVGVIDTLVWHFEDPDGNRKTCFQKVIPVDDNDLPIDCDTVTDYTLTAEENECYAKGDKLELVVPVTADPCVPNLKIYGVATRADGKEITDDYPTGETTIIWTFTNPNSTKRTKTCEATVFVRGNKPFAPHDCETMFPRLDTVIADCGPTTKRLHPDSLPDPCIDGFMAVSVPYMPKYDGSNNVVLDSNNDTVYVELDTLTGVEVTRDADGKLQPVAATDTVKRFNLGANYVTWVFTDSTKAVTDTCRQLVYVKTKLGMEGDCPKDPNGGSDYILYQEEQRVDGSNQSCMQKLNKLFSEIVNDSLTAGVWDEWYTKKNPCITDENGEKVTITPVFKRADGRDLDDEYLIGLNKILIIYNDVTNVLEKESDTCIAYVQIGSSTEKPIDCDNYPDVNKVLDPADCEITGANLPINIVTPQYECNGETQVAKVSLNAYENSLSATGNLKNYVGVDNVQNFLDNTTLKPGNYFFEWRFEFMGTDYLCEQKIQIKDDKEPVIDCSSIPDLLTITLQGDECEAAKDAVVDSLQKWAVDAIEKCTQERIRPVFRIDDGTEKGADLPAKFAVGEPYKILFLYENDSLSMQFATCNKSLQLLSSHEPIFECDSLKDVSISSLGECEVAPDPLLLPVPVAKDFCTDIDVAGVGTVNGVDIYNGTYKFPVGNTTVTWTFKSPYSVKSKVCEQLVNVRTDKKLETPCDVEGLPDINKAVAQGECEVNTSDINIPAQSAKNPCTSATIAGVPYIVATNAEGKVDTMALPEKFRVGQHKILWVFKDESMTLKDTVEFCEQTLNVGDSNKPAVDCENDFPDKSFDLGVSECNLSFRELGITPPEVKDLCTGTVVVPVITRESGKDKDDPYVPGVDVLVWTYTYEGLPIGTCNQKITIHNDAIKQYNCDVLFGKTELQLSITSGANDYLTFDQIKAAGVKFPTINDPCDVLGEEKSRKDIAADGSVITDRAFEDNYYENTTIILTWTVFDKTTAAKEGDTVTCSVKITIDNAVVPEVDCPVSPNDTFECDNDLPEPYETIVEFQTAGGRIEPLERVDQTTFTWVGDVESSNNKCSHEVTRTYTVNDLRGNILTCDQTFLVIDNKAPEFAPEFVNAIREAEFECSPDGDFPTDLVAYDLCSMEKYTVATESENEAAVATGNFAGKIYYNTITDRSKNPNDCSYYNYERRRVYSAYDYCGNVRTLEYKMTVIDTVPPKVVVSQKWIDSLVVAQWRKGCVFTVPDVISLLPAGSISDNCNDAIHSTYIDSLRGVIIKNQTGNDTVPGKYGYLITQEPGVGDTIQESMYIKIRVQDACGNDTVVNKWVEVPTRESIVNVNLDDATVCASVDLKTLYTNKGEILVPWRDTYRKRNSVFVYDYYYYQYPQVASQTDWNNLTTNTGKFDQRYLKYSNNPRTYNHLFNTGTQQEISDRMKDSLNLNLMHKTGTYLIVAMDTLTECYDTTMAFLTVHERPRLKMDPGKWGVCEDDSIHITEDSLYQKFNVCVNDMGSPISSEGWMVGLNDTFRIYGDTCTTCMDSIIAYTDKKMSLVYYATNDCGTSTTYDSYKTNLCLGDLSSLPLDEALTLIREDADMLQNEVAEVSVELTVMPRLKPDSMLLITDPRDKARVFAGESAELQIVTKYMPAEYQWYRIEGLFDGRFSDMSFDRDGNLRPMYAEKQEMDAEDALLMTTYLGEQDNNKLTLTSLTDTASYYVLVLDKVCPAVVTNVVSINVVTEIPTAFTPHGSVGMNDVFMEGYPVIIFNRYGQKMTESDNGWDGTCRGVLVDPGVYFYEITLRNGETYKGSVEVVYFK